jgi:hypothetical protein
MLPEAELDYFKATFVRNPYDRAYSGFLQIQRDFAEQPKISFSLDWIGELIREQISNNMELVIRSGFDFDNWIKILPEHEVRDIGRNTNMPLHPAHYWTHVHGEQWVDFFGKVESFEEDFSSFTRIIDIEKPKVELANVTCHENLSNGYRYTNRMNKASIDRINHLFEEDFKLLNYEKI